jgi:hypothetical protein
MATVRERVEALARHGLEFTGDAVELWPRSSGEWVKRADVLALADELDRERAEESITKTPNA